MGRGLSVQGSNVAPFPMAASAQSIVPAVLPAAPANVDLGTVTLPGGNVAKKIEVSVEITTDGAQTITLQLFKNGVLFSATDVYVHVIEAASIETLNAHWYDSDPGAGQVTYSVRGSAAAPPSVSTANNRRVTATTAAGL